MRVTIEGQVTIPQDIREKLGIVPADEVVFMEEKGWVYLLKKKNGTKRTSIFGDKRRHPKMSKLIHKAGSQLIRRRFSDIPELTASVYASLVEYLERAGKLQTLPFDAAACPRMSMGDISSAKLKWFLAAKPVFRHPTSKNGRVSSSQRSGVTG